MSQDESDQGLSELAWKHIAAEEYEKAEETIRRRIAIADPKDAMRLWHLCGLLASTLNSLSRPDEAMDMLRESLTHARVLGPNATEVGVARCMLANQALIYGDPRDALAETTAIPEGSGHIQCLLHSVAAQALWKLERRDESRQAARSAINSAPTDARRAQLAAELEHILGVG
jgi:tetratricopeptide (TPR) repeat protein